MPSKRSIVIAEDHMLVRNMLHKGIEEQGFNVLFQASNGMDLIEKLTAGKGIPELILMDISMPVMNGISATKLIKEKYPKIKILGLSLHDDEKNIIAMFRAGATGYITKNVSIEELVIAMNTMLATGYYISEVNAEFFQKSATEEDKPIILDEAELLFMSCCCSDDTYDVIADKMGLTLRTVQTWRELLFKKIKVKSRVGLVMYAIRHDIYKL